MCYCDYDDDGVRELPENAMNELREVARYSDMSLGELENHWGCCTLGGLYDALVDAGIL